MDMKGCYDTEAHYAYFINESLNKSGYTFSYDNETLLRQKRYKMIVSSPEVKYIVIKDVKLSYILGMDYAQIGKKIEVLNGSISF